MFPDLHADDDQVTYDVVCSDNLTGGLCNGPSVAQTDLDQGSAADNDCNFDADSSRPNTPPSETASVGLLPVLDEIPFRVQSPECFSVSQDTTESSDTILRQNISVLSSPDSWPLPPPPTSDDSSVRNIPDVDVNVHTEASPEEQQCQETVSLEDGSVELRSPTPQTRNNDEFDANLQLEGPPADQQCSNPDSVKVADVKFRPATSQSRDVDRDNGTDVCDDDDDDDEGNILIIIIFVY